MGLCILQLTQGKTRTQGGGLENVESMFIDLEGCQTSSIVREGTLGKCLGNPGAQKRANKEFEPFELCLNYDKAKVGFRVRIARLQLNQFDLSQIECISKTVEP